MEREDTDFLQEMEQLLDQHDYALPEVGDIRTGIIVSLTPQGVIVDLGVKRDGIIPPSDLEKLSPQEREALQVNEEIDVYIVSTDQPDSLTVSRHMALLNQDWQRAQELLESGEIFEGEIVGYNRGGALVAFGGLRGFIPASHLSMLNPNMGDRQRQQRLSKMRGEMVPLKVIEVDRRRRRLVLSQRDAEKVWQEARRRELMEKLQPGDQLTGRVSGWRDFGAFVDLGGVDGLVHVSELAWHRVAHPRDVVKIGDEVDVYVLKIDRERERISLSRKRLLPNPWSFVEEKYAVGELVEGRIIRIVDYGAFVELEPGVEGLLHLSQLSRSTVKDPHEVVQEGETHLLRVISVDSERERIGLSLKAVRAQEQIEWMTQRELEAAEAAAAAEQDEAMAVDEVDDVEEAELAVDGTDEVDTTEAEADVMAEAEEEPAETEMGTAEVEPEMMAGPEEGDEMPDEAEAVAEMEPALADEGTDEEAMEEAPVNEVPAEMAAEDEAEVDSATEMIDEPAAEGSEEADSASDDTDEQDEETQG